MYCSYCGKENDEISTYCKGCGHENRIKANFCEDCGQAFSQEERDEAYRHTIFGFLDKVENMLAMAQFKFLTDNLIFKSVLLVTIFSLGIFTMYQNGLEMRIEPSEQYEVYFDEAMDRYVLMTEDLEINLDLYVPHQIDRIALQQFTEDHSQQILEKVYTLDEAISLEYQPGTYYEVHALKDGSEASITISVTRG